MPSVNQHWEQVENNLNDNNNLLTILCLGKFISENDNHMSFLEKMSPSPARSIGLGLSYLSIGEAESGRNVVADLSDHGIDKIKSYITSQSYLIENDIKNMANFLKDINKKEITIKEEHTIDNYFSKTLSTLEFMNGNSISTNKMQTDLNKKQENLASIPYHNEPKINKDLYMSASFESDTFANYKESINWGKNRYLSRDLWHQLEFLINIKNVIKNNPSIDCIINFGSFYGWTEFQLSTTYPHISIYGCDRSEYIAKQNDKSFKNKNLAFGAGNIETLTDYISKKHNNVLITHCRTGMFLTNEKIRSLYNNCLKNKIRHILSFEQIGYSSYEGRYFDFNNDDTIFKTKNRFNFYHNYKKFMEDANYCAKTVDSLLPVNLSTLKKDDGSYYLKAIHGTLDSSD